MLKISCWNVNSIRARLAAFERYVVEHSPDILLLQEVKSTKSTLPLEFFEQHGYNLAASLQKSYNGVLIASRYPIDDIKHSLSAYSFVANGNDSVQDQGASSGVDARFVEALVYVGKHVVRVASVYVPHGFEVVSAKFQYKLQFLEYLYEHLASTIKHNEIQIIGGDYNVAPEEIDVYDPVSLEGGIGFHQEERKRLQALFSLGYKDAFRLQHPSLKAFSWWDYQNFGWKRDRGMRIDNLLLSPQAVDVLAETDIAKEVRGWEKTSDHVPITCTLKLHS